MEDVIISNGSTSFNTVREEKTIFVDVSKAEKGSIESIKEVFSKIFKLEKEKINKILDFFR